MFNKTNSRGSLAIVFNKTETTTRERVWEPKENPLLPQKWGDENTRLQLKLCPRKKPIRIEIATHLRAAGYEDRDDGSWKTRIHTDKRL